MRNLWNIKREPIIPSAKTQPRCRIPRTRFRDSQKALGLKGHSATPANTLRRHMNTLRNHRELRAGSPETLKKSCDDARNLEAFPNKKCSRQSSIAIPLFCLDFSTSNCEKVNSRKYVNVSGKSAWGASYVICLQDFAGKSWASTSWEMYNLSPLLPVPQTENNWFFKSTLKNMPCFTTVLLTANDFIFFIIQWHSFRKVVSCSNVFSKQRFSPCTKNYVSSFKSAYRMVFKQEILPIVTRGT